ncbi:MAG: glycosyltransferase [Caulobacteraceae bacterium]
MKLRGGVEYVRDGKIVGWSALADPPDGAGFVSIYEDDKLIGTALADIYRDDGADGPTTRGFSFAIPDRFADGAVRVLSIYAGPGVDELEGSPVRVRFERLKPRPQVFTPPEREFGRKRAAVVCWDLGHNPAGRAYVYCKLLAPDWDVELIGPTWAAFGGDLWTPLQRQGLSVRSFQPATLLDVWREGARLALAQTYDLVAICKPRLPGLILGLQIAEQSRCPIMIDIDEDDRVFTSRRSSGDDERELIEQPYGAIGTELAYRRLDVADAITVSNPSLQTRFSGRVVRHARDEAAPRADRERARRRLGLAETDFVIAFVGTARPHKVLSNVLDALRANADPSVKLLLAGSLDEQVEREIKASGLGKQVIVLGPFDLGELGGFLAAADLVPILQNVGAEISSTQIPAKLSDALQYGVRAVATDAPPFRDIALKGAVDLINGVEFAEYLATVRREAVSEPLREHRIRVFEEEFSFAVNRPRLALAIEEASRHFDLRSTKVSSALSELLAETRAAQAKIAELRVAQFNVR